MVDRVMVMRLRPVAGILAVLALLALPAIGFASVDGGRASDAGAGAGLVIKADAAVTRAPVELRVPPPLALAAGLATAIVLVVRLPAGSTSPKRVRRCLDDVGDDWRSLLLGAPPVQV
jgi:hypothetical protein